jgi:hypothetical protein
VSGVSVVALSGFPAGAILWEAVPGQRSLTVIVKATFSLVPGELTLAPRQDGLLEERNWDDGILSSLHFSGDFAPSKRRVDVSLVGHAYTPGGTPKSAMIARLVVGELDKAIHISGDRTWDTRPENASQPGPPSPFVRMPLRYERAALSADNPIGVDGRAPPNLEPVSGGSGTACFGPIAPTWRARRSLCDDAATFWAYGVARDPRLDGPALGAAPPRFDFAFFNAAPPDQQVDLLRPGTPIELENLHPDHARLVTRLPKLKPQVFATPTAGAARTRVEEIIVRCDSLWIDTDRTVAVLTWRGLREVPADEGTGTIVVVADLAGKKLRWAQVEKWLGEKPEPTLRLGADGLPTEEIEDEVTAQDMLGRRHDALKGSPGLAGTPSEHAIDDDFTRPLVDKRATPPEHGPRSAPQPSVPRLADLQREPPPTRGALTLRKDLTLERCAEIGALLAEPGADRSKILRTRLLTEASWAVVEKHWQRVIAAEAERGERTTADAFDEALVLAHEHRSKPIDLAAYARLTVGVERGEVGRLLGELELELADLVRLQRVWARRAALSPELAADLARAIHDARRA